VSAARAAHTCGSRPHTIGDSTCTLSVSPPSLPATQHAVADSTRMAVRTEARRKWPGLAGSVAVCGWPVDQTQQRWWGL